MNSRTGERDTEKRAEIGKRYLLMKYPFNPFCGHCGDKDRNLTENKNMTEVIMEDGSRNLLINY